MSDNFPIMTLDITSKQFLLLPRGFGISRSAFDYFSERKIPMKYYSTL